MKLGDYYVLCDRCGLKFHAKDTRLQWDNLLVCNKCWEPRNELDYIKVKADDISVPIARPEPVDVLRTTTLSLAVLQGSNIVNITDSTLFEEDDPIGITTDNGQTQWFQINDLSGSKATLSDSLAGGCSAGNKVTSSSSLNGNTFV